MIKCKMKVERIMFPKNKEIESGDFAIFVTSVIELLEGEAPVTNKTFGTVSLKGNVPSLKEGDIFNFTLDNPETNQYGTTYNVMGVSMDLDVSNKSELKSFLKVICGNSIADELMKLENPYQLIEEKNSEELLKVKGIGEVKLKRIYSQFDCFGDKSLAYAKLQPLGLSKGLINKMCNSLGGSAGAIDMCFNNPYGLIDKMKGIGFIKADDIAQKCGYSNVNLRVKYGILYILELNAESGKSYLTANQLLNELKRIVPVDFFVVDGAIRKLVEEGRVSLSEDGNMVALMEYLILENEIAKRIMQLLNAKTHIEVPRNWRETVKKIEDKQGWCYTDEQMEGIETVLYKNVVLVRGLAGTGKSTVTNAMSEVLDDYEISLCCLSAKASQRLREVTGRNAQTIHRLLGLGLNIEDEATELYSDIIILDEASMVNGTLFLKLIKAIREGSKLIILGDTGQLTAIGNCSVFNDLINSGVIPVVELTKIHRQAQKSAIITESRKVREQKPICESNFRGKMILGELQDLELFVEDNSENLLNIIKQKFKEDLEVTGDVMEVQIITPTKTKGKLSVANINYKIQQMYNFMCGDCFEGRDGVEIYVGDKVINLKNNYSSKDIEKKNCPVWNGSIGEVISIEDNHCVIDFVGIGKVIINREDYENINLGYAISCHSSQGSQWKRVIFAMDMGAYMLLNVEILYTGITRASENCALIVEIRAMQTAIRKVEQKTKQTLLPMFLKTA